MANRLAGESSPYLLQHAANPVEWYPWGQDAFARARAEDRPIFLSIGYSTCHWCHVMAHESFESDDIAHVLNEDFISIKVDREERPDVDRVYMAFVQATTGSGGWPMSVWLTPELKPFYGGTYFPPTSRWGRPGFVDVLRELARVWRDERPRVHASADRLTSSLHEAVSARLAQEGDTRLPEVAAGAALAATARAFRDAYDSVHGGIGPAPKFPRPSELVFLLREAARTGADDLMSMAVDTLRAMSLGGMRDHVGGGFHRYSVDEQWRVPHFEKMLYDQAQLVLASLEAAQATGDAFYATVAEDTLDYVERELTHPDGGFYSAEDADSVPSPEEGVAPAHAAEGAFYVWSEAEIARLFDEADARLISLRYGVEPNGNAPTDPHGEFTGKNILYIAASIEELTERTSRTPDAIVDALARARQTLFHARANRPRPHLDDKILTSWNGLMIAAWARASRVVGGLAPLDGARYGRIAERAARFVLERLWHAESSTLKRRWRAGEAGIEGFCEDYASFIWGLLELFQATGRAEWLEWAVRLQARQDALFWDEAGGGWFSTTGRDPSVLLRLKEDYDGAEPAATSIAVRNLLELAHLTDGADGNAAGYADRAERALARLGSRLADAGRAVPCLLTSLISRQAGISQVVIVGPRSREDTQALWRVCAERYIPFAVFVPVEPGETHADASKLMPWLASMTMVDGRATAYVCREFACEQPVTSIDALAALLAASR